MEVAKPIHLAKQRRARAPWVFELGPATLIFTTILLVSVTSLLYLTQASRVAATGYDIRDAEERRARLERQQQLLVVQVAELQALSRVETEAAGTLGMVPAPAQTYLPVGEAPVDVEAGLRKAEREAQHLPRGWRERLATAMRMSKQPDQRYG